MGKRVTRYGVWAALTVAALLYCAGPVAAQWPPVSPLEPPPTIGITSDGIYLPVVRR